MRLCAAASARASSSLGCTPALPARPSAPAGPRVATLAGSPSGAPGALGATAIEHPLGVGERASPALQQHEQVVEHVGGLLVDALRRLLARGAGYLLGLLHHLLAEEVARAARERSEEHTSGLQSRGHLVCRLLL